MMNRIFLISLTSVLLAGCSNAIRAHWDAIGSDGRVTCYSGGRVVFDDYSDGKIQNAAQSDGYEFMSLSTGRLVQVSGACIVDYGSARQPGWKAVRS